MNRAKRKIIFKDIIASKVFLAASLAVLVFVSLGLVKVITRRMAINRELASLSAKIGRLEDRNSELTNFIDYLRSDEYLEEAARTKMGLQKPGEKSVVLVGNNATETTQAVTNLASMDNSGPAIMDIPNPYKWWRYFFAESNVNNIK